MAEIKYLRTHAGKLPAITIAERLHRSIGSVYSQAYRLDLKLRCERKTRPCPKCGKWRSQFTRKGECQVCRAERLAEDMQMRIKRIQSMLPDYEPRPRRRSRDLPHDERAEPPPNPLGVTSRADAAIEDAHALREECYLLDYSWKLYRSRCRQYERLKVRLDEHRESKNKGKE
jgi:hypothetical protein